MTPRELVARLDELIGTGRDEDALELATRFGPMAMPKLDAEEVFRVASMLEGAELAVSLAPSDGTVDSGDRAAAWWRR
jgi:hypothetical protein